jgi:tRNA-specific 2-thiouridylase
LGLDHHESLFVLKIDAKTHTVWVGDEKYLFSDSMELVKTSWLGDVAPGEKLKFKIRAHHEGALGRVESAADGRVKILFDEPQRAVTPGQAAVAYRGDRLVGGGWITGSAEEAQLD